MNAQPGSEPTPESGSSSSGAEPAPGPDVGPGHAAIVITPADAAVQTNNQAQVPSSVTFSQGLDDPRTTLARRLLEGPSSSSSQQQPVTQRLVEAVREIRATIDRAPGLAERINRIAAATAPETTSQTATTFTPERRRVAAATAAPVLFEFQQRRAARASRVTQTTPSAVPVDAGFAPTEPPALVPAMRRVRYNADGEEISVQPATPRALDGRPLFHVVGGRPRPIPRRASAETVIVPESPRDSDGEADIIVEPPYWTPPPPRAHPHLPSRGSELASRLLQLGGSPTPGSSSRRNVPDASELTYGRWREAMVAHMDPDGAETQTTVSLGDSPPASPALRRQHARVWAPPLAPAGISDSAWRTRMEFLTSTVNLPLGDNPSRETTRSASPLRPEAASVSKPPAVQREEPPALVPCPLPQPIEDMTASDEEEEAGSALQPGVLYW
ncbi:hypothetical protein AURDEDRAFT_132451 [Auricularia subglabra TFB-10046 SS5]|nr:hypothetical protein AURDEDRAFT_132451 [Auricularia subglabra TFB-10046 SS5]